VQPEQPERPERPVLLERLVQTDEKTGRVLIALSGLGDQKKGEGNVTSPFFNRYGLIPSSLLRTLLGRVCDTPQLAAG
jgi:hypothetical protein